MNGTSETQHTQEFFLSDALYDSRVMFFMWKITAENESTLVHAVPYCITMAHSQRKCTSAGTHHSFVTHSAR